MSNRCTFVNCDVVGLVAFDKILGFRLGGVMDVAFELHVGNDPLQDYPSNTPSFRVPFDVIAAFELLHHLT